MPDTPFPILGTSVPPLLGRAAVLQKMMNALTKAAPDHLQVVGPRFAGKTVLLHGLAGQLRYRPGDPFTAVFMWDLGPQTPATDRQFMQRLAEEIGASLKGSHPEYAEHLMGSDEGAYQDIAEVLDLLAADGLKVLAILDGFDKPMAQGGLSRNLWDQLRELALKPSLRLVTASRRTLRNLIRDPETETSPFFNIFNQEPVRIGCFDETDLNAILARIQAIRFEPGARTELWNETNGNPVLLLSILNSICESGAEIASAETVRAAVANSIEAVRDILGVLWRDCSPTAQDLVLRVLDAGSVPATGVPGMDGRALIERGFVHATDRKLERPSRLLRRFLDEQPNEGSAVVRLFGTPQAYRTNLKGALERRIAQLVGLDATLKRYLERGIEELPDHPDVFMSNVRGIVNQAFEMIWRVEIPDRRIPSEWIAVWKHNDERGVERWETTFPQGVHRVRLLNCMTGTDKSAPCAVQVTKTTYVLINAIHGFGDFGQHQEGAPVEAGTAYAALHLCIELAASLLRELSAAR